MSESESTYDKGDRNETEAKNILARVFGKSCVDKIDRYGTNDPFEFVDIMAINPGEKVLFVQVKTNRFTAKDRRQYGSRAQRKLPHEHARFEVWVRVDREGWRMHRYDPDAEGFEQYIEMDTCDHETTVEAYREAVGYYDEGDT